MQQCRSDENDGQGKPQHEQPCAHEVSAPRKCLSDETNQQITPMHEHPSPHELRQPAVTGLGQGSQSWLKLLADSNEPSPNPPADSALHACWASIPIPLHSNLDPTPRSRLHPAVKARARDYVMARQLSWAYVSPLLLGACDIGVPITVALTALDHCAQSQMQLNPRAHLETLFRQHYEGLIERGAMTQRFYNVRVDYRRSSFNAHALEPEVAGSPCECYGCYMRRPDVTRSRQETVWNRFRQEEQDAQTGIELPTYAVWRALTGISSDDDDDDDDYDEVEQGGYDSDEDPHRWMLDPLQFQIMCPAPYDEPSPAAVAEIQALLADKEKCAPGGIIDERVMYRISMLQAAQSEHETPEVRERNLDLQSRHVESRFAQYRQAHAADAAAAAAAAAMGDDSAEEVAASAARSRPNTRLRSGVIRQAKYFAESSSSSSDDEVYEDSGEEFCEAEAAAAMQYEADEVSDDGETSGYTGKRRFCFEVSVLCTSFLLHSLFALCALTRSICCTKI